MEGNSGDKNIGTIRSKKGLLGGGGGGGGGARAEHLVLAFMEGVGTPKT